MHFASVYSVRTCSNVHTQCTHFASVYIVRIEWLIVCVCVCVLLRIYSEDVLRVTVANSTQLDPKPGSNVQNEISKPMTAS